MNIINISMSLNVDGFPKKKNRIVVNALTVTIVWILVTIYRHVFFVVYCRHIFVTLQKPCKRINHNQGNQSVYQRNQSV